MRGILPSVAYNPAMTGILAPKQPSSGGKNPLPNAMPVARQAEPRRTPLLETIWGLAAGYSPGATADIYDQRERAREERLRADAMRPQLMQRQNQLRALATQMGPAAQIAFETNPEAFGESLGMGFRPVTASAGSAVFTPATGQTFGVPSFDRDENETVIRDPVTGQVRPVYTRTTPSIDEAIKQQNANTAELSARTVNVAPNARVIDPVTRQVIGEGYRPPEIQPIAEGASATVFRDGVPVTTVQGNPETPAGGARQFDAQTRGQLQTARQAAGLARSRAADAQRFLELNRQNATGLGAAVLGPAAGLNPAYAEMRAISARLVPQERTPGSGPMSDRDVALYGRAVLDVDKPGPTNQALAGVVIAAAQRDQDYAAYLDEFASRNGNLNGAEEDWQAYANANPLFDAAQNGQTTVRPQTQSWRDFMGWGPRQRGGSGQASPARPQASGPIAEDANGNRVQWNGSAWVPI